jgi:protein-S-isoprenylcysteine O-methyltransferase Ste14
MQRELSHQEFCGSRIPLLHPMSEVLRLSALALFAVGPVVASLAILRRASRPCATLFRISGWRRYVPAFLLPVEWLLPPVLIALRFGEIEEVWLPVRVVGLGIGLAGVVLLVWAFVLLGPLMIHEAAVREDHTLIANGPYRFVRHPVYAGYLALLLGSGIASSNVCLMLLWPVSLVGILIQAASEEQVLRARFGEDYERYLGRTGRLFPRLRPTAQGSCGIGSPSTSPSNCLDFAPGSDQPISR